MLKVQVHHTQEGNSLSLPLCHEILEDVSKRAFGLFQERGSTLGHDLDDWFQAERELLWAPPAELTETESQFKLRLAAPGYEAKDLQVTAFPDAIIVSAEAQKEARRQGGTVHVSELTSRRLFRRLDLPSTIDVEKVTAYLDQGVLRLVAVKSEPISEGLKAVSSSAAA